MQRNIITAHNIQDNSSTDKSCNQNSLPLNFNFDKAKIVNNSIVDKINRPLHDIRISVTDRCNFRCSYCMPSSVYNRDHSFLPKTEIITYEEILRVVNLLIPFGLRKVRITGGEPLIRQDLPTLISALTSSQNLDVALTTNGSLLKNQLKKLHDINLKRITISLDAINNKVFVRMNDVGFPVSKILETIKLTIALGIQVKVNMVVMKGLNESEILPMAEYFRENFREHGILRFIEFMDVGNLNQWQMDKVVPSKEIINIIANKYPLKPIAAQYFGEVARRFQYEDGGGEIGIISSVTAPFCGDCSRLRLSANGQLYTCLFSNTGYDLRSLIRAGASDDELINAIGGLWQNRTDRYSELRNQQGSIINSPKTKKVEMSYIGG